MNGFDALEQQLIDGFLKTLRSVTEVQAEVSGVASPGGPNWRNDGQVDLRVGEQKVTLLIEVKRALYPRDARQALWQMRKYAGRLSDSSEGRNAVFFLVAQSISPGAKALLRRERVGYYDSGGSLFIPASNIYVFVDKPPPKSLSKSIRSVFSGRRAQVLHAILRRNRAWFGVKEIAHQARVSPATASQVLTALEKFDWVVSRGQGPAKERHLEEPGALLDAWVNHLTVMRPLSIRRFFAPTVRSEALVEQFAEACAASEAEYAITHEAAGQMYTPFLSTVSQVRCRLLGGAAADGALDALDARSVDQGANLAVISVRSRGELLFRESVNGIWLASAVQVYLDLMLGEGRAADMAKHLRHERIGF